MVSKVKVNYKSRLGKLKKIGQLPDIDARQNDFTSSEKKSINNKFRKFAKVLNYKEKFIVKSSRSPKTYEKNGIPVSGGRIFILKNGYDGVRLKKMFGYPVIERYLKMKNGKEKINIEFIADASEIFKIKDKVQKLSKKGRLFFTIGFSNKSPINNSFPTIDKLIEYVSQTFSKDDEENLMNSLHVIVTP